MRLEIGIRAKFNYSFDVRGKPLQQARHWSAPEIFGSRAKFNTNNDPATLDIEVKFSFEILISSYGIIKIMVSSLSRTFDGTMRASIDVASTFVRVKHKALDII
jgi:hypothetical protein